jgi:hypothetical protein
VKRVRAVFLCLLAAACAAPPRRAEDGAVRLGRADRAFVRDLERRNLRYFLEQTDPVTGLTRDRAAFDGGPSKRADARDAASVAATGFGLAALCAGVADGDLPRAQAVARARRTLSFLKDKAPQERGFFYHFLDVHTGARMWDSEASSIDTALLLAGALTAKGCLGDAEVGRLADALYARADFPWMLNGSPDLLAMGWTPERGFIAARWDTYSEHMILDLLAIGSPAHPIPAAEWDAWKRPVVTAGGETYVAGVPPLFIHQYSQAFADFRGLCDRRGLDYFENSRRATLAQRAVMAAAGRDPSGRYAGWSDDLWGLTSSDDCRGGYRAWGAPPLDPVSAGTVVPSAPGGSLMFAPRVCLDALRAMKTRFPAAYGRYGFADSFRTDRACVNPDALGIDQGITLLSAGNLQGGIIWKAFMKDPDIRRAMDLAGLARCARPPGP